MSLEDTPSYRKGLDEQRAKHTSCLDAKILPIGPYTPP